MNANGGIQVNYEYDRDNFSLSNSEDEIIIFDLLGFVKDRVEYNSSFPDPNGKSMELLLIVFNFPFNFIFIFFFIVYKS